MITTNLDLPQQKLAEFCQRWQIHELALFDSALRPDFGPKSDVDLLVTFEPAADWSLFDHIRMRDELSQLFKREVDLLTRRAVERSHNQPRRDEILKTAETIYVSG